MSKENEALLANVSLFAQLDARPLKVLAASCTERSFKAGETIIEQGATGIGLMIIASGRVRIVKKLKDGREVEVATMGPGEFFGEISVLDDAPRTADVVTAEPTECLVMSSWSFKAVMTKNPEIALAVLDEVVQRYRNTHEKLADLDSAGITD